MSYEGPLALRNSRPRGHFQLQKILIVLGQLDLTVEGLRV